MKNRSILCGVCLLIISVIFTSGCSSGSLSTRIYAEEMAEDLLATLLETMLVIPGVTDFRGYARTVKKDESERLYKYLIEIRFKEQNDFGEALWGYYLFAIQADPQKDETIHNSEFYYVKYNGKPTQSEIENTWNRFYETKKSL